ncbi:hypothetical protein [Vibrio cyclitrophicus]|nr:hypothetical protein [Vibrio cyclitrophicus]
MLPSDSSELQAYVMTHNRMTQPQAQAWLDKWAPSWRTEEPNKPVGIIFTDGKNDEDK